MSFLLQGFDNIKQPAPFNALLDKQFNDGSVTEPVTRTEAIAYCKINASAAIADVPLIDYLITTARQQCEDFTGLSIIPRTVTAVINNSCGGIFLHYCPFISLTSIKDEDGDAIDPANYKISGTMFPQLIYPRWNRMTLVYTAGYGSTEWPLPQEIKTAILAQVFYLYENRGDQAIISRTGIVDITLSPQTRSTLSRIKRVSG